MNASGKKLLVGNFAAMTGYLSSHFKVTFSLKIGLNQVFL